MSYDLCKRIVLKEKENKVTITVASNNVYPKIYRSCIYCNNEYYKNYTFNDKLMALMKNIMAGDIQFCTLNDNTIKFIHAQMKINEYLEEHNLDDFEMYCNQEKYIKEYGELLEVFKKSIFDNDKNEYYLKIQPYSYFITRTGRFSNGGISRIYYGYSSPMKFKKQLAEVIQKQYKNNNIEIIPA